MPATSFEELRDIFQIGNRGFPMHRAFALLAYVAAIIGGLVLVALMILMSVSILMRAVGLGEINGVYEILEAGVGFAIFAFFPICQIYGGHATVDIFTSRLPDRLNRIILAFWEIILTAILIFISWRLYEGLLRYLNNGETTLFLQFPVWWSYSASFAASVITGVVGIYCAVMRVGESLTGHTILPRA